MIYSIRLTVLLITEKLPVTLFSRLSPMKEFIFLPNDYCTNGVV